MNASKLLENRPACSFADVVSVLVLGALLFAGSPLLGRASPAGSPAAGVADTVDENPTEDAATEEEAKSDPADQTFWEAILLLESDKEQDQKRGRELLREAADLEHAWAQFFLGEACLRGSDGFAKNQRRAVEFFRLAAERGHSPSKIYLGICQVGGMGTRKDRVKARAWLEQAVAEAPKVEPLHPPDWFFEKKRAAAAGNGKADDDGLKASPGPTPLESLFARAHYILGLLLDEAGEPAAALPLYEAAASWGAQSRAGVYDAARRAAMAYALGRGTKRDLARANVLLAQSRDLVHASVMTSFHTMWSDREIDDFELADYEEDVSAAADWQLLKEQEAVADALIKDNPSEAVRWCELAAEAGEAWAMLKLAEVYYTGKVGPRDPARAFSWYERAAREKDAFVAWGNVSVCLKQGIGTPRDEARAAEIIAKHQRTNFICALAGAGQLPRNELSFAAWWDVLERCADKQKLPVAQYHMGLLLRQTIPVLRQQFSGLQIMGLIETCNAYFGRASAAGVPDAMYEFGSISEARDPAAARRLYEQGLAAGHSGCAVRLALLAARGRGETPDRERAIALFTRALELDPDNAEAHQEYGFALLMWHAKDRNAPARAEWEKDIVRHLEEADRLESGDAAFRLGEMYLEGHIVPKDASQAYICFQNAADRGVVPANLQLARMHEQGIGVPVTPKEAFHYYRLGALENNRECLGAVCDFYLRGIGVSQDLDKARFWLLRLVDLGNMRALFAFGDLLLVQENYAEARKLWTDISRHKVASVAGFGFERLSWIYERGLGVKANPGRAEQYLKKALAADNPDAWVRVGQRHVRDKKPADAVAAFEKAAMGGSIEAKYLLGYLLYMGDQVPKDVPRALDLLREAAASGHTNAKVSLAFAAYQRAPGAPTIEEALRLLEEAEAAGHPKARALRDKIEARHGKPPPPPAPTNEPARST
jgi:uncharacterized protein